jgi:hypothetical protein
MKNLSAERKHSLNVEINYLNRMKNITQVRGSRKCNKWFSDFIFYLLSAKCLSFVGKPTLSLRSRQCIVFLFLVNKCLCGVSQTKNRKKVLKITRAVGRRARSTNLSA